MKFPSSLLLVALCALQYSNASPVNSPFFGGRDDLGVPTLTQGDMVLTPDQLRNGMIDTRYRWPNGVVFYALDIAFNSTEVAEIMGAISDIESKSCIRFQARTNQADYAFIQRGATGSGCWAYVGRIGGRQIVNLEANCIRRTGPGPHELVHAIGFHHEHSRQDRDEYVRILWENIDPSQWSNFDKSVGTSTFGFPYDYLSIMQYPRWGFSHNGQDAIQPIPNNDVPFGPYNYLSVDDGRKINAMYEGYC